MTHLVPVLLLFLFPSPPHSQPASLPDAPGAQREPQLEPQTPVPSPSAPTPATPDPHWFRVEQLPPGKTIAVLEHGREYPTSCSMDSANDTTLTCTQATPYSPPRRLVFPMRNVADVFTEEMKFGPSLTAVLVGAGIGAGLAVGVCNEAPVRTILVCSLFGSGIGAGVALSPSPLPRPRRRLIYSAP